MKIEVIRRKCTETYSQGEMLIDGKFLCFTLEDAYRRVKIMHETCIPEGTYRVAITKSQRWGKMMPELLDVPGFTGIRIHSGNTPADTSGCILVGLGRSPGVVSQSVMAYNRFMAILEPAVEKGEEVTLKITREIVDDRGNVIT